MPSMEEIVQQQQLLTAHRARLAHYLGQRAQLGMAYEPPGVSSGIREAREDIQRCKAALRGWGVVVEDQPDDDHSDSPAPQRNLPDDVRRWIDRCYDFVVDTGGEIHSHIYARQTIDPTQVSEEWIRKHREVDERARRIELDLQDRILPKVVVIDSQLADILRRIGEHFEELRFALWNVESDRNLQAEHRQAAAQVDALLGLNLGESGYSHLPCPICSKAFTRRQALYDHFRTDHPRPPMGARVLIDVGEHHINVDRAVGPLRALFREVEQYIARL